VIAALNASRRVEKEQTQFYRALAAEAEIAGDSAVAERLNSLHADEQHHLSRLTARLIELGARPPDLSDVRGPDADLAHWEAAAADRERKEVANYEALLACDLDPETQRIVEEIVEVERHHAQELGGKWTRAG